MYPPAQWDGTMTFPVTQKGLPALPQAGQAGAGRGAENLAY